MLNASRKNKMPVLLVVYFSCMLSLSHTMPISARPSMVKPWADMAT